jgi:hypothetical protein
VWIKYRRGTTDTYSSTDYIPGKPVPVLVPVLPLALELPVELAGLEMSFTGTVVLQFKKNTTSSYSYWENIRNVTFFLIVCGVWC